MNSKQQLVCCNIDHKRKESLLSNATSTLNTTTNSSSAVQISSFPAILYFEVQKALISSNDERMHIKPNKDIPFTNIDVLKPCEKYLAEVSSSTSRRKSLPPPPLYILNPAKYKPSTNKNEMKQTLNSLRKDIKKAGACNHSHFVGNGYDTWGYNGHLFKKYKFECQMSRLSKNAPTNQMNIKLSSTNNSRKNDARPMGHKNMKRRTMIQRPIEKSNQCNARMTIFCNNHCFFLQIYKSVQHTNHSKIIPSSKKARLSEKNEEDTETMTMATTKSSSIAMGVRMKTGVQMTRQEAKNIQIQINNCNDMNRNQENVSFSPNSAEAVRDCLHNFGCQVLILRNKKEVMNASQESYSSKKKNSITNRTDDEQQDQSKITMEHLSSSSPSTSLSESLKNHSNDIDVSHIIGKSDRVNLDKWIDTVQVRNNDGKSLICLAWQSVSQHKIANSFHLNLNIDATHKTCKIGNLSMLTITTKDSFGKTYVILRMWIPNQKVWMFRYVFLHVIPTMIGLDYCKKIRAITSDGDIHLIKVIEEAVDKIFVNAVRIPCSWHIVDRSMLSQRSKFVTRPQVSPYWKEWFLRGVQTWLYSFMRPRSGIESHNEYLISKCLLLALINSPALKKFFTDDGISQLNEYLQTKIFCYESTYVFYKRKELFNFEVHSNSAHEGTNLGIKKTGDEVRPTDTLLRATEKMAKYDQLLAHERDVTLLHEYKKTKTFTRQWKDITTHAVGIVVKEMKLSVGYICKWYGYPDNCFYVVRKNVFDNDEDILADENNNNCGNCEIDISSLFSIEKHSECTNGEREDGNECSDRNHHDSLTRIDCHSDSNSRDNCTAASSIGRKRKEVSLKDLSKMKKSKLINNMTNEEKHCITNGRKKNSSGFINTPSFVHSYKVHFERDNDSGWRLFCDCHFDNRFGGICRHKFCVDEMYLKKIGKEEWNSSNISVFHHSSYAYLSDKSENELDFEERKIRQSLLEKATVKEYEGTLCNFCGEISTTNELFSSLKSCNKSGIFHEKMEDRCPRTWRKKSAIARVKNYSVGEVQTYLKEYDVGYDSHNYIVEFSQGSEFDDFTGEDAHFEVLREHDHDDNDDNLMKCQLESGNTSPTRTKQGRANEILKKVHDIIGITNLNDDNEFKFLSDHIDNLHKNITRARALNNDFDDGGNGNETYFPGPYQGNRNPQTISNRDKKLKRK